VRPSADLFAVFIQLINELSSFLDRLLVLGAAAAEVPPRVVVPLLLLLLLLLLVLFFFVAAKAIKEWLRLAVVTSAKAINDITTIIA
jgi:hypothetical protein